MKRVEEMLKELPPELQQEVEDFVQFLIENRVRNPKGKFRFDWEGPREDLRDQYTSVELQHKLLEWGGGLMYLVDTNLFIVTVVDEDDVHFLSASESLLSLERICGAHHGGGC